MQDFDAVIKMLDEKREAFVTYMQVTEEMLTCPLDELESLVIERDRIINEIDTLDVKIESSFTMSSNAEELSNAISGKSERGSLDGELGLVYDAASNVRAVISRIPDIEIQINSRIQNEQEKLIEHIKNNNRGISAQASRFAAIYAPNDSSNHITNA